MGGYAMFYIYHKISILIVVNEKKGSFFGLNFDSLRGIFRCKNKFLIRSTICMNVLLYLMDVFPDC